MRNSNQNPKKNSRPAKENIGKSVLRNSLQHSLSTLINRAGGLVFTIIVARMLSPELFGIYSLTLSLMLIALTFADFGLGQTLIRYVSDSLGKKDKTLARSYFRYLLKFKLLLAFAFSLALFLLAKPVSILIFKNPALVFPIWASSFYLFVVTILDFLTFAFFAAKVVKFYTVRETIFQILRVSLTPIALLIFSVKLKVVGIFLALTIASIIALVVTIYFLRKNYSFLFTGKEKWIDKKKLLRFSFLLIIGILPGVFFTYIDSIILGAMVPVEYVGFFRAAYTISTSIGSLLMFYLVLMPFFTQLEGKELQNLFKKIFHFSSIVAFPLAFGVAILSVPVISLLFGQEYLPAALPLRILSFMVIDIALFSYFPAIFQAKEKPEVPTKLVAIAAALNIALNLILIRYFVSIDVSLGMVGASIATFISRFAFGLTIGFMAARQLKLKPDASSIFKPLFASIIMSAFLILLMNALPNTIAYWILGAISAAVIYLLVLFLIKGIKKEDFSYIKEMLSR